ncbi:hypothetical protein [Adhaeretor mobilis]|uniref:Uncharacterized protein n=1 Tax=Adhaeretor mobilis TaxID=1930276 RepID=A0A517MQK1_9BACT|nr:hypothetical protein [Adhaeretor mobilis]QDS97153.1 hypothetical protein HG15A2_04130 [Adhaeretor mobilis]
MTHSRTAIISAVAVLGGLVLSSEAHAQRNLFSSPTSDYFNNINSASQFSTDRFKNQAVNRATPRGFRSVSGNSIFSGPSSSSARTSKPFANVQPQSNLSPYLNIGGFPTGDVPNYHSLVRPQIQQQQQAQQRRTTQQSQQAQSAAAQAPYQITGAADMVPTGHGSSYQNYTGSYQNLSGRFLNYGGYFQGR